MFRDNFQQGEVQQPGARRRVVGLVRESFSRGKDQSANAQAKLIAAINDDLTFNTGVLAIDEMQKNLLDPRKSREARRYADVIENVLLATWIPFQERGLIDVEFTPEVTEAITGVFSREEQVNDGKLRRPDIPIYQGILDVALSQMHLHLLNGSNSAQLSLGNEGDSPFEKKAAARSLERWMEWHGRFSSALKGNIGEKYSDFDGVMEIVSQEPIGLRNQRDVFWSRSYGRQSLLSISKLPYGMDDATWNTFSDFFINVMSSRTALHERRLMQYLFTQPKPLWISEQGTSIAFENADFIGNLNEWQEQLFVGSVFAGYEVRQERIAEIFSRMDDHMIRSMIGLGLMQHVIYPELFDREIPDVSFEFIESHPMMAQAVNTFFQSNDHIDLEFTDLREICYDFLYSDIIPVFESFARGVGVDDKVMPITDSLKELLETDLLSDVNIERIKNEFEANTGNMFLERLEMQRLQVGAITESAWQSIVDEGVDILPMAEGVNIVTFSDSSLPKMLGINSMKVNRVGDEGNWSIRVSFDLFDERQIAINGSISEDGTLKTRARIDREIPALHMLLNHIAVLALRDLTTIHRHEASGGGKKKKKTKPSYAVIEGVVRSREELPRVSSDREITREVNTIKGVYKPRIVELHPVHLRGWKNYLDAVRFYSEVMTDPSTESDEEYRHFAQEEVVRTRDAAHKISPGKITSLPKHMQLESIVDPVSQEPVYLQTWRVEHSSPKPSDEELGSPVLLYKRYYQGASSLSFLDQLKPWIIGDTQAE